MRENALFVFFIIVLFAANWWFVRYPGEPLEVAEACGQLVLGLYLYLTFVMLAVPPTAVPDASKSRQWRGRAGRTLIVLGMLTMYVLCALESFLVLRFNMRISPSMLMLCMDTTAGESQEFLEVCVKSAELQKVALMFGGIGLVHIILRWRRPLWACLCRMGRGVKRFILRLFRRTAEKTASKPTRNIAATVSSWRGSLSAVVSCLLLLAAAASVPRWVERQDSIWSYLFLMNSRQLERCSESNFYSAPLRMVWSVKFYAAISREADVMAEHTQSAKVDGCSFKCPKIVCIIGESYNKHHSSLYGYQLPTAPKQQEWWNDGRLVIFEDVVSPWNLTSNVFKDLMSTHSCNEPGGWTEGVLFPAVFRRAGYHVAFLSNQFYADRGQANCDVNGSFFLNRSDMDTTCFDKRSRHHYTSDGIFVRKELGGYKHHDRELVFVHLYGQHMQYRDRVPKGNAHKYFSVADYDREELSPTDLQTLADYDNACRYNDMVIDSIYSHFKDEDAIFVYFSDHGEYVYDGKRVRFGRTHESEITREMARNEFEVPMVVFFTPRFRDAHPDIVKRLEEVREKPMGVDDVPHLLMGLAGIRSPHYSPKHDILHPKYDATRKRILRGNTDYDGVMKRK